MIKLYTPDNNFINIIDRRPDKFTGVAEYADGSKEWFLDGKLHRLDGPAVEWPNGYKEWFINGAWHRIGGPAVEYPDGRNEWWINKKSVTEEQHNLLVDIMKLKGFYD